MRLLFLVKANVYSGNPAATGGIYLKFLKCSLKQHLSSSLEMFLFPVSSHRTEIKYVLRFQ